MMNKTQMVVAKELTATALLKASKTSDTAELYSHFANMTDQKTRVKILVETLESELLEARRYGEIEDFDADIYGEALLYLNEDYPGDEMVIDLVDEFIGAVDYYEDEYGKFYCTVLEDLKEVLNA